MNDKTKSVIVLTVICFVVTALLSVTNSFTAPVIEKTRAEKIRQSLQTVLPDAESFGEIKPEDMPDGIPQTVKAVHRANDGSYAVVLAVSSNYSGSPMGITAGIADGRLVGVMITNYQESKDFGKDTYPQKYVGLDADEAEKVDVYAGVTYSSKAFKAALADAFTVVELINGGEGK